MKSEIQRERERIKYIVATRIDAVIAWREENIKVVQRRNIYEFEKLKNHILWLIDHPEFKGKFKQYHGGKLKWNKMQMYGKRKIEE